MNEFVFMTVIVFTIFKVDANLLHLLYMSFRVVEYKISKKKSK